MTDNATTDPLVEMVNNINEELQEIWAENGLRQFEMLKEATDRFKALDEKKTNEENGPSKEEHANAFVCMIRLQGVCAFVKDPANAPKKFTVQVVDDSASVI